MFYIFSNTNDFINFSNAGDMSNFFSHSIMHDTSSASHVRIADNHFQRYYDDFLESNERSINNNNFTTLTYEAAHSKSHATNTKRSSEMNNNEVHSNLDTANASKNQTK
jgi:hypothetical protein